MGNVILCCLHQISHGLRGLRSCIPHSKHDCLGVMRKKEHDYNSNMRARDEGVCEERESEL